MLLEHRGRRPRIHDSAYVAPNAVVCGDVTVGENCRILFGAVLTAEGGPILLGSHCIIMENAVLRGTQRHPVRIGDPPISRRRLLPDSLLSLTRVSVGT